MTLVEVPTSRSIQSLPDDVLRNIFAFLILSANAMTDRCATPPIFLLSNLCRQWRALILRSPFLWTDIRLPMKEPYDGFVFFEMSAPALFDVSFSTPWSCDTDFHHQVSKAILDNLHRLRRIEIYVLAVDELHSFFDAWRDKQAPNFSELVITCHDSYEPQRVMDGTYFEHGSSLRTVKLSGLRFMSLPSLPNLTRFEIDRLRPEPHTLQALCSQCPTLETLIIGEFSAPVQDVSDPAPFMPEILAPYLKTLAINLNIDHAERCTCALPNLTAENLEYLEISHFGSVYADEYVSISSHFKRSEKLQRLRIRSHLFQEEDMPFLASLPKTTNLEVIGFPSHRDPEAGLPILNLTNLQSVSIDLTSSSPKNTDDFDIVAFHGLLHNSRPAVLNCTTTICCDCDEKAANLWKMYLGEQLSVQPMPLQPGWLDAYAISDDYLDGFTGSSDDECFGMWGDDEYDYDGDDDLEDEAYYSGSEEDIEF